MWSRKLKDSGVAKGEGIGACPPVVGVKFLRPINLDLLLQAMTLNEICYAFGIYLQLLGAFPPDLHCGSAPGPRWRTSVSQPPVLFPLSKFLATPLLKEFICDEMTLYSM